MSSFVERKAPWFLGMFVVLYFLSTWQVIRYRPLWMDEIVTYSVARLPPSLAFEALRQGTDGLPPLFYLLTHWLAATGNPTLIRLPAMAGVLCMAICLYFIVSRLRSRLHGLIAMLFPFLTMADTYAYEGRPYGIVLGGSAAALLFWQGLGSETRRGWKLFGLWFCAALVIASHYYGLFILIPLAAAEGVRWLERRRPDGWVALVLACSMLPLLFAFPFIRNAARVGRDFYSGQVNIATLKGTYADLLGSALWVACTAACIVVIGVVILKALPSKFGSGESNAGSATPLADLVAITGFAALPLIVFVFGLIAGGFTSRYALTATIGFAAAFACLIPRRWDAAALCVSIIGLAVVGTMSRRILTHQALTPPQVPLAAITTERLPIVYQGPHQFAQTEFYAPQGVADHMYFLTSPSLELKWTGRSFFSRFLGTLSHISTAHTEDYQAFLAQHSRFILVTQTDNSSPWVLSQLSSDGATIRIRSAHSEEIVYDVTVSRPGAVSP